MKGHTAVKLMVLSIVLLTFIQAPCHVFVSGSSSVSWPAVRSDVVMIVQGENDITPGQESKNDFYALKIISYELPYDVDRVHARVPADARSMNVWTQMGPLNETAYGRETSGNMTGALFIDVPASHPRVGSFQNTTGNESAFISSGSILSGTTYSSGALRLSSGSESGTYASAEMPVAAASDITSGNLTLQGSLLENVTSYLSNDGGSTWTQCYNATELNFTSHGTLLKVRLVLDGNTTLGIEPSVTSFALSARYTALKTTFSVHISYLWTEEFVSRTASIDLNEALPYTPSGSFIVMFYALKGYVPSGAGFNMTLDEDSAMNTYPDKELYLYSAPSLAPGANFSLFVSAPKASNDWVLYAVGAVSLLGIVGFGYISLARRKSASGSVAKPDGASASCDEDKESRRSDLVAKKKELLIAIEAVKAKPSEELSAAERKRSMSGLKSELKHVRNELNKLPRQAPSVVAKPDSCGPPSGPYDAMLASLARLDDDFEKGRLPEGAYRTLRKDYVSKAAALMASRQQPRSDDPLLSEKSKLMEAIVALDEEHDKGEVPDDVYKELRASYRKELASVMRKMDESGKER